MTNWIKLRTAATKIQSVWRGCKSRKEFICMKAYAIEVRKQRMDLLRFEEEKQYLQLVEADEFDLIEKPRILTMNERKRILDEDENIERETIVRCEGHHRTRIERLARGALQSFCEEPAPKFLTNKQLRQNQLLSRPSNTIDSSRDENAQIKSLEDKETTNRKYINKEYAEWAEYVFQQNLLMNACVSISSKIYLEEMESRTILLNQFQASCKQIHEQIALQMSTMAVEINTNQRPNYESNRRKGQAIGNNMAAFSRPGSPMLSLGRESINITKRNIPSPSQSSCKQVLAPLRQQLSANIYRKNPINREITEAAGAPVQITAAPSSLVMRPISAIRLPSLV